MTEDKLKELRNDIYMWLHFVLSDKDFLEAMESTYDTIVLHQEIAAVLSLIRTWTINKTDS